MKVKSQKEILNIIKSLKKAGKKIVVRNGSFDLLHLGHIKSLQEAKAQGDILIVLLNSDKSVKSYKSPGRPIIPQKERALMLSALECVDYVVIFDETTPEKMLAKIKPDVYCVGYDHRNDSPLTRIVRKNGGTIHKLENFKNLSTTKLIKKISRIYSKTEPAKRAKVKMKANPKGETSSPK